MTGLYAFASGKGARLLVSTLSQVPDWRRAAKRWVISIDGGITEPAALRYLLSVAGSEVRVPNAEDLLRSRLRPTERFHPKTMLLEGAAAMSPVGLLVGSANMTFNGLCIGHEHAMGTSGWRSRAVPASLRAGVEALERTAENATLIDEGFIQRYERIRPARPSLPEEFENKRTDLVLDETAVIDPPAAAALAASDHFWIQIEYVVSNRGGGQEGNQIDMQRGSRVFFGFSDRDVPRNSPLGTVTIIYGNHRSARNLRYGNNQMDKLDLPIPGTEGPPSYANQTLLFTRLSPNTFTLTVGTSRMISTWKRRSRAVGASFRMRSGREFGAF